MGAQGSSQSDELRPILDVVQLPLTGIHLIEASAGTGKTYNIAALFLRLIVEQHLPIQKILAVTFTKLATSELRARVEKRLRDSLEILKKDEPLRDPILASVMARVSRTEAVLLLDRALSNIDQASIFTIHGFAARAIAESAFEARAKLSAEITMDVDRLAYDAVVDFWSLEVRDLPAELFGRLGGIALFARLEKVAHAALVNVDVRTVQLDAPDGSDTAHSSAEAGLRDSLLRLREEFSRSAGTIRALLTSGRVKRNLFQDGILTRALREWELYLRQDSLQTSPPEHWARFKQSFVQAQTAKGKAPVEHAFFAEVEVFGRAYAELQREDELARARLYESCVKFVRSRVGGEQTRRGTKSFDDLLLGLRDALDGPVGPALKATLEARYSAALIDEFQDTDPLQYRIFRDIFADRTNPALFLIGDPKQSIYAFRGADVLAYLKASRETDACLHSLRTSYRASPRLVRAQNAIFQLAPAPFLFDSIVYDAIEPAPAQADALIAADGTVLSGLDVTVLDDASPSPLLQAAREVHALLVSGSRLAGERIQPRNIAVLCRKNQQAQEVQGYLRALRVPAVMHGDRSVFESPEALEIRRVLRALIDPGHRTHARVALASEIFGLGVANVARLDEQAELLEDWDTRLRRFSDTWRSSGFFRMIDAVFRELSVIPRLLGLPTGERVVTNLRHVVELLHQAEAREHLGALGLLRYLESCIADPFGHGMAEVALQIRLESDDDSVVLTTIHKSKGLEYDIVILPTLGSPDEPWEEPAFRTRDEQGEPELELRSTELAAQSHELRLREHQAESLRVTYVGLTHARQYTRVLLGKMHQKFSPFSYLLREYGPLQAAPAQSWQQLLPRLLDRAQGSIRSRAPAPAATGQLILHERRPESLAFQPVDAELPSRLAAGPRTASFSSMTRDLSAGRRVPFADRDHADAPRLSPLLKAGGDESPARLCDFPKGAWAGEALHEVFEKVVWSGNAREVDEIAIREVLTRYGIAVEFAEAVRSVIADVLQVPLMPYGFRLCDLEKRDLSAEVEFHLSMRATERPEGGLAKVVRELECLPRSYRERFTPFSEIRGFLRGFIDLVFEWEGRVFVIDYKSNYLGERMSDYDEASMQRAMDDHHYHIQGLIYGLAVSRHAKMLRADYDHERHFGGVYYLFLRGIGGDGGQAGVYFFRPSEDEMRRFELGLGGI